MTTHNGEFRYLTHIGEKICSSTSLWHNYFPIEGTLRQGEAFVSPLGNGMGLSIREKSGVWKLEICDMNALCLTEVSNPPFRSGVKPYEIEGWHFRSSDNTGPNDGSTNAPGVERKIYYIDPNDFPIAKKAFECGQNSTEPTCDNENAMADFDKLNKKFIVLRLSNLQFSQLNPGEKAVLESFRFTIDNK